MSGNAGPTKRKIRIECTTPAYELILNTVEPNLRQIIHHDLAPLRSPIDQLRIRIEQHVSGHILYANK